MRTVQILRVLCAGLCAAVLTGCGGQPESKTWDVHTQGLPFVIGFDQGLAEARDQRKPAMMFVTTTWCGWCKKLAEESFNDPEVRTLLGHFVCVIVDGDVESDAKRQLQVDGYPNIVFLSPEGEKLGECRGYKPTDQFKSIVESALAAAGQG